MKMLTCFILTLLILSNSSFSFAISSSLSNAVSHVNAIFEEAKKPTQKSLWRFYEEPKDPSIGILKKGEYKKLKYKDIARSPYEYADKPAQFTGYVWFFEAIDDNAVFVIYVNSKKQKNLLMCFAKGFTKWSYSGASEYLTRLLPGDKVVVFGYVYGEVDLQSESIQSVPLFRVDTMTIYD